ncbi:MAG: 50S ribosomal protein L6 [Patescibacteria group bacterium]
MSRIGKKPIEIPKEVQVQIDGQNVRVRGPKGEISREFRKEIKIEIKDGKIFFSPREKMEDAKALWGLTRTLVANMIGGVTKGYEKKLEIEGIGYRAGVEGDSLVLHVGYSHSVVIRAPKQIKFSVDKNIITVEGLDKEKVGEAAARIRAVRKAEPYKGKGIKYQGELVRRKLGKKAVTSAGG